MTKAELIAVVAKEMDTTKAASERIINAMINQTARTLKRRKRVSLTGLGILEVVKRKNKKGRNPQTGEEIIIKAHKTVKFKPSKALREQINQ